jgi:epoxide hydrolase-like predicted phosphatase
MIKYIIFDMGGVILKWKEHYIYKEYAKIMKINAKKVEKEGERLMPVLDSGRMNHNQYLKKLIKNLHSDISFSRIRDLRYKFYASRMSFDKDVLKIIKKLKAEKYRLILLTNTIPEDARYNKKKGYYKEFDRVFLSCQLKMRKPGKKIFSYALRKIGAKPSECFFVDNLLVNVHAAKSIGIHAVLFRNAAQLRKDMKKLGIRM